MINSIKSYSVLIVFSFFFFSCGGSGSVSPGDASLTYNIIMGEGGGVTGLQQGYSADTSGVVFSFRGRTFDSSEKEQLGKIPTDNFSEINMMTAGLDSIEFRETGNIYKYIILKNGTGEKRLSWSNPVKAPVQLEQFYQRMTQIIKNIKTEGI